MTLDFAVPLITGLFLGGIIPEVNAAKLLNESWPVFYLSGQCALAANPARIRGRLCDMKVASY